MKITVLKTFEIDDEIWDEIEQLYSVVFPKVEFELSRIRKYYENTVLNYSFHGIAIDKGTSKIIGYCVLRPYEFIDNSENKILGSACGAVMVLPEYRKDPWIFYDLYTELRTYANTENVKFSVGLPNNNALDYSVRVLGNKKIGNFDLFIFLPIIGRFFNLLVRNKRNSLDFMKSCDFKSLGSSSINLLRVKKITIKKINFGFIKYRISRNTIWVDIKNFFHLVFNLKSIFIFAFYSYKPENYSLIKIPNVFIKKYHRTIVLDYWCKQSILPDEKTIENLKFELDLEVFDII